MAPMMEISLHLSIGDSVEYTYQGRTREATVRGFRVGKPMMWKRSLWPLSLIPRWLAVGSITYVWRKRGT
jgi:hypothetical protein